MRDLIEYCKELNNVKKVTYLITLLLFISDMMWAIDGERIFFTYVPIKNLYDLYVVIFPFAFVFINSIAIIKKKISDFLIAANYVLLFTYPPYVHASCIVIDAFVLHVFNHS